MATLYLVRHGQASFGSLNYDQLSKRGWEQGRVLGSWLDGRVRPGGLVCGTLQRHRETVEAIRQGYRDPLPSLTENPGFNEFDHRAVIERWRPEWADASVMATDLARHERPAKAFQEAFLEAVARWAGGCFDDYPESWPAFKERVLAAFERTLDEADAGDLIVVSSGGPIMVIMQHLLELTDETALGLNNVMANAGLTRILFSGKRRSLAVFNSFAHLEATSPKLVTYR